VTSNGSHVVLSQYLLKFSLRVSCLGWGGLGPGVLASSDVPGAAADGAVDMSGRHHHHLTVSDGVTRA